MEADFIDITDSEVKVHLLLTSDLLIVINLEDDCQQQAFSLREVEICSKITSPQILTILWKDSMQPPSSDQVAQESLKHIPLKLSLFIGVFFQSFL